MAEVVVVSTEAAADFTEVALVSRAAAIEGVDMAAATAEVTGAMAATATVDMVDTADTDTDQVF